MGGTGDDEGCPSREEGSSNQEEDAVSDKSPRKARYVWQIKGNYHLKCPGNGKELIMDQVERVKNDIKEDTDTGSSCSSDSSNESSGSEESRESPSQSSSEKRSSPVWYRPRPDWPVLKWQTRQVAKAFVDNTINCVLEDMGFVPLPADSDDILDEEFSTSQREQNDNSLEDKAVLMAIQSHGLHRSGQVQETSYHRNPTNFRNDKRKYFCPRSYSYLHCENSDLRESHPAGQMTSYDCSLSDISNAESPGSLSDSSEQNQSEIESICVSSPPRTCSETELHSSAKNRHIGLHGQKIRNCPDALSKQVCTCPMRNSGISEQGGSNSQKTSLGNILVSSDVFEDDNDVIKSKTIGFDGVDEIPVCNSAQVHSSMLPGLGNPSSPVPTKRPAEEAQFCSDSKRRCTENLTLSQSQANVISDPEKSSEGKLQSFEHFDFMDAAVVAAIQKKGLSALACTEYG